jgi:hypothetical protein
LDIHVENVEVLDVHWTGNGLKFVHESSSLYPGFLGIISKLIDAPRDEIISSLCEPLPPK